MVNNTQKEITLKTGDVILIRNKFRWYDPMSWLSAFVRFFAKIKFNHCGIIISNWGVFSVNEAIGRGVLPTVIAKKKKKDRYIRIIRYKKPLIEKNFAIKCNSMLGITKYDFIGLLFYQLIFQLFHIWIGRKNEKALKRMYCYEYVAWAFDWLFHKWWQINPIDLITHKDFENIYEGDFKDLIIANDNSIKIYYL